MAQPSFYTDTEEAVPGQPFQWAVSPNPTAGDVTIDLLLEKMRWSAFPSWIFRVGRSLTLARSGCQRGSTNCGSSPICEAALLW